MRQLIIQAHAFFTLFQFTHPGRGATGGGHDLRNINLSFNSRTPGGVRHRFNPFRLLAYQFQFTHPGRGATYKENISGESSYSFNSRTPGGVRRLMEVELRLHSEFQFTHPGRGATDGRYRLPPLVGVSIHAPREGCDRSGYRQDQATKPFQFTHPGRGATISIGGLVHCTDVSIHAPREGCDRRRELQR